MKTILSYVVLFVLLAASAVGIYAQETTTPTPVDDEPTCAVSTPDARTVNVHVGPGENRTSVTFLPANVDIAVTGQSEDDDGNLWYQVDKETAAPGRAINEAWVLAEAVETEGECEEIADAIAPPIIPIIQRPTPSPSGDTDAPETDSADAAVATNIMPNGGSWTLGWGATTSVSCESEGLASVVPTTELFPASDMVLAVDLFYVSRDDYFAFGFFGTPMIEQGNGTYRGEVIFIDDTGYAFPGTIYIDSVVNPNQVVGRFIVEEDVCTGTFTYVANHN